MVNPAASIVMMLLMGVIMLVSQVVPFISSLVLTLISLALASGLMYGVKEAADGRTVNPAHLFKGLIDRNKQVPMLILGAVLLGVWLLISNVVLVVVMGRSVGDQCLR